MCSLRLCVVLFCVVGLALPQLGTAQSDPTCAGSALNLTIEDVGLIIDDSERTTGVRLNYRDRSLDAVHGPNLTLWVPYEKAQSDSDWRAGGTVNGIAVGLPLTGAKRLRGVGIGAGIAVETTLSGVAVAPIGLGSGSRLQGIAAGGLGVGAGERLDGIVFGGLGAGAGENANSVLVGGLGAGAGGSATGFLVGGAGAGAGEDAQGILFGGLGVGAGQSLSGIIISGGVAGSQNLTGLGIAGGYMRIEEGVLRGVSVSGSTMSGARNENSRSASSTMPAACTAYSSA